MIQHELWAPDPRMQQAIDELKATISAAFPATTYDVHPGIEDPNQTWLVCTVDIDDTEDVTELVIDRVMEMQLDDGLPIHVIPILTVERDAELRARQGHRDVNAPLLPLPPMPR